MSDGFTGIPLHAAQNDHEAATAIRSAYLKIENRLGYARSLFGYARVFMILGAIAMMSEAFMRKTEASGPSMPPRLIDPNRSLMPQVFQYVLPLTAAGCVIAAGLLLIVQWQLKRVAEELEPGHGTGWTKTRGIALLAFISTLWFPIPFLFSLPVFFLLPNAKTSVVLSSAYAGIVQMTPDITLESAISNQGRKAWWLILLIVTVALLMLVCATW